MLLTNNAVPPGAELLLRPLFASGNGDGSPAEQCKRLHEEWKTGVFLRRIALIRTAILVELSQTFVKIRKIIVVIGKSD